MKNAAAAAANGQFDRRPVAGTPTTQCRIHFTTGAWYLVGEGMDSRAYCDDCHLWLKGIASEFDTRNVAAYDAYITSPATTARLKQIALGGAKTRIKFGPLGRRRVAMSDGPDYRYGWDL